MVGERETGGGGVSATEVLRLSAVQQAGISGAVGRRRAEGKNPGRKRDQSEDVKEREAGRKRNAIKDGGGERKEE